MSSVSEKILSIITQKNISYGELSKLTGIPKSALQRYATGQTHKIPIDRLEQIAKALGTTPSYLTQWDELVKLSECEEIEKQLATYSKPTIHDCVHTLRIVKHKSPIEVASALNIDVRTYNDIENGNIEPGIDCLIQLANYFGVTIDYLVGKRGMDEFSKTFRNSLSDILPTLTGFACEPEVQEEYNRLCDLLELPIPLTLDEMKSISTWLDVSLSRMLGSWEEESAPTAVSSEEDALNQELISRLVQLTPAELEKVDAFVQGILASR